MAKNFALNILLGTVDRATANIRRINGAMDQLTSKAKAASKRMVSVGKTMSTHLTLPIVAVGVAAVRTFSSFETGMSNVNTLIDSSKESIDDMGKEVLAIGRRTPVALNDLTAGLFDVRSAGLGAAEQFVVLEKSAQLGVAGLGSTKQAVDLVTSSINTWQLRGEDALKVYDTIFRTTAAGKTTIAELSQGFGAVAGTVAKAGIKLDDYLSAVAALTTTGRKASKAHTQLQAAISNLTKVGGKKFTDLIKTQGGLVGAFKAISAEVGGNDKKLIKLVGSVEAYNAIVSLTGAQNKIATDTLKGMRSGVDAVGVAYEKQSTTTASSIQLTKNALAKMAISVGKILAPALKSAAEDLQGVADWFDTLSPTTKKWTTRLLGLLAALGPILFIVGKMTPAIVLLSKGVVLFGAAMKAVTLFMIANPILAIVTAIAVAALLIQQNWEPIADFFVRLWDLVKVPFVAFGKFVAPLFEPIVAALKAVWGTIAPFFEAIWDAVAKIFEAAFVIIKGVVDKIMAMVTAVKEAAKSLIDVAAGVAGRVGAFVTGGRAEFTQRPELQFAETEAGAASLAASRAFNEQKAGVTVTFENAPPGMRATADRFSTANVLLKLGYQQ